MRKHKPMTNLLITACFTFSPPFLTDIFAEETTKEIKEIEYIEQSEIIVSSNSQRETNSDDAVIFEISIANEETISQQPMKLSSKAKASTPQIVKSNVLSISFLVGVLTMCTICFSISHRSKVKKINKNED